MPFYASFIKSRKGTKKNALLQEKYIFSFVFIFYILVTLTTNHLGVFFLS